MNATTLSLQVSETRTAPRLAAVIGGWAAALWAALPTGRAESRFPAHDVARVRALAHSYERTDRRFASELYAAADHYEARFI